jgi:CheY-like chemotaxis protein
MQQQQVVLIIEDDPDVRDLLAHILTKLGGYDVISMESVFGAAQLVLELQPAAILLDLGLPFRPGTELVDSLKADYRTADIPIIVVSGLTEVLSEQRRPLAAAVLTKPIDPDELLSVLRRFCPENR